MFERRDAQGKGLHLRCHGGIVGKKEVFDKLGGRKKEIARLKDLIHITVTMKRFIPSIPEIFGRDEKAFCPFNK
jgi:hypothetical protein